MIRLQLLLVCSVWVKIEIEPVCSWSCESSSKDLITLSILKDKMDVFLGVHFWLLVSYELLRPNEKFVVNQQLLGNCL